MTTIWHWRLDQTSYHRPIRARGYCRVLCGLSVRPSVPRSLSLYSPNIEWILLTFATAIGLSRSMNAVDYGDSIQWHFKMLWIHWLDSWTWSAEGSRPLDGIFIVYCHKWLHEPTIGICSLYAQLLYFHFMLILFQMWWVSCFSNLCWGLNKVLLEHFQLVPIRQS